MSADIRRRHGGAALLLAVLLGAPVERLWAQPPNLAKDCPYTMAPPPNYSLTTDAGDDRQLTDGAYTAGNPIWLRSSTVGWAHASPVTIVIDLRSVQAVSGISYSTAAGTAGVAWPRSVFVLVSDDGQRFFPVADLVNDARKDTSPPATGYAAFRYAATNLDTHGRYVAVIVDANGPYVFTDEIEVLAGDPGHVGLPLGGESTTDLQDFFVRAHMRVSVQRRLTVDLGNVRNALESPAVPLSVREPLSRDLDVIESEIAALAAPDPAGFRTVLPLNDLHTKIFAIHGAIAGAAGFAPLAAWPANPWDFVRPLDKPPAAGARDTASIAAMNGETRAGAITVSSATDRPLVISANVAGLPVDGGETDLHLFEVVWTDTRELIPVADALLPLDGSIPAFVLPAGMTRQIWLTFAPRRRAPGTYRGYVELSADGIDPLRVPIELRVLPGTFPMRASLHLGGWDYTNTTNALGLTPTNRTALVEQLKAIGVDSPWATTTVLPPGRFDNNGRLLQPPHTSSFDDWIAAWPGASAYFVFIDAQDRFGNVSSTESARFSTALGEWITFWVQHAAAAGVQPSQLVLLLVDEPHSPAQDNRIVTWARAIKAAQPAVRIWENPTYSDPSAAEAAALDAADVLAIKTWLLIEQGGTFAEFFRRRGARGQELALYGASGPARLTDPYSYQRLQGWICAAMGAASSFFWSFSDDAGGHSWNEYGTAKTPYSPFFLAADQVTTSKHAEAIREGVEDFEYVAMLRRRLQAIEAAESNRPGLMEAAAALDHAVATVLKADGAADVDWTADKDRAGAERMRLAIASTLEAMEIGGDAPAGRAAPSITLTGGTVAYDGEAHPAIAAATGAYGVRIPGSFVITYAPGGSSPPVYGGVYSITAQFTSADPEYGDGRASQTITIVEPTSTRVSASAERAVFGQPVTFVARVQGAARTPSGPVRFYLDGEPVGADVRLQNGLASVTIESLAPGRHAISADYGGSDGFSAGRGTLVYDVAKAIPVIDWRAPAAISFGTALDAAQLNATANVSGTFAYTPVAGTVLPAGARRLELTFVPADRAGYDVTSAAVTLAVLPATPLVAANAVAAGYDGSPHPITASATGRDGAPVAGSVTIEYVPGGESPPVAPGTYSATATFHSDDPNYLNAAATTIVTIACAADKERGRGKPPAWIRAQCRQRQ